MRGLLRAAAAACVAAPSLVSAVWTTTHFDVNREDVTSTLIQFPVPGLTESPAVDILLSFDIRVNDFQEACGFGNAIINGQPLAQKMVNGFSQGEGLIAAGGQIVDATWNFSCIHPSDEEISTNQMYLSDAQILDFTIRTVNGEAVSDVAFWVQFSQYPRAQILSAPFWVDDSIEDIDDYNFRNELAQLEWMKAQVLELEYQIYQKEEALLQSAPEDELNGCDSLKCVFKGLLRQACQKASKAMKMVYSKIAGHDVEESDDGHPHRPPWKRPHWKKPHCRKPHWRKPHWRKPHWRKPPFHHGPKHGNHSHGNHTCHPPHHGNHTHPHPHPHPRPHPPPPSCRCDGPQPPPPPPHSSPPKGPPGHFPSAEQSYPASPGNDEPSVGIVSGVPTHAIAPKPATPPTTAFGHSHIWRKYQGVKRVLVVVKVLVVGSVFLILLAAFRRCCCSNARRQAKRARREERRRRRAFRHAALKNSIRNWVARYIYRNRRQEEIDEEEKRAMLSTQTTDAESDIVGSEISEFRNAASIVSDIISAEEGRVSTDSRSSLPDYMSEIGGERLPVYDDDAGSVSGLSSVVADGFRYTPGSTEYSPLNSEAGSVRSVLGDMKE